MQQYLITSAHGSCCVLFSAHSLKKRHLLLIKDTTTPIELHSLLYAADAAHTTPYCWTLDSLDATSAAACVTRDVS